MTTFNRKWALTHIRKNWDTPVPTTDCPYCDGTGRADERNECGFCEPDDNQGDNMTTDNTELERRLAWQQAAYAWEQAWRACNDMASHMNLYLDDLDVTPYEQAEWDEKERWLEDTLKKATLLTQRAEDTTPDPF